MCAAHCRIDGCLYEFSNTVHQRGSYVGLAHVVSITICWYSLLELCHDFQLSQWDLVLLSSLLPFLPSSSLPCPPRMKPRDRPQSPKYGGHDGPRLSDSPRRSCCLCTRLLLQLRTGVVSRADLPPGRTKDLLPRLCIGEGKRKPWMVAYYCKLFVS